MGGPVRWFIDNPIAANLLMVLLIVGGVLGVPAINKQFFPDIEINSVSITLAYPGAGPSEIEEQVCIRIEEAIHDITGIKEIRSSARQGLGTVTVEAQNGYDTQKLTAEIKNRVDAIDTFPVDAERPVVTELAYRHTMAVVTLAGELEERRLKELGESLRDDLSTLPWVSVVELSKPRPYEVAVELTEYNLRRFGISFNQVVSAIRGASLNLPAGTIKAKSGDIRLQTRGQAYSREDFESIVVVTRRDGTQVLLGDVADVTFGFEDIDLQTRFNNRPSHNLTVFVTQDPDVLRTSAVVSNWVEEQRPLLPPGVELALWRDAADPFRGRVETLLKNGIGGLILVFAVLVLFLRPLLAMWVSVGIAVAFMGTLAVLQFTPISLNMLSLFAFLLILGIVVDDAIIVGESIYARQSAGDGGVDGAHRGAKSVLKPVMYAVISTMIFFVPMFFMPGDMARSAVAIPVVVIIALTFSLVESLWILPPHLAHMRPQRESRFTALRKLEALRRRCADGMVYAAKNYYRPVLDRSLKAYPVVGAIFLFALLISLGLYGGGWLRSAFFPSVNSDYVQAEISLPEGGPFGDTLATLERVEVAAEQLKAEYNSSTLFGEKAIGHIYSRGEDNKITVTLETVSDAVDSKKLAARWEEAIGGLPEAKSYSFEYTINRLGKPISLVLVADRVEDLKSVSQELRTLLAAYPGVYNISDSLEAPRDEVVLDLKPAAETLSVTLSDLARQVREGFYGAEAQRIPLKREDVRVMVRYPEADRVSVDDLANLRVRTPGGAEVPFEAVADVQFEPGYQTIERLDRKRVLEVSADVVLGTSSPRAVVQEITRSNLARWQTEYPGLEISLDGELEEEGAFRSSMLKFMMLAMLVIYGLMAIPFRSYWQPILVLTAVPFGIMGAIFGHLILDWQVSMFSLFGVIACAGVVVNDNLVLIDRINQLREEGLELVDALLQAGEDRFRPIILTSLTTFIGLLPIMSETSVQAQFLIPMVTSLAFGVLFATGVTLLLVPCLYLMGERLRDFLFHWIAGGGVEATA
ncbi:MAG: efflux RND transporter permease subunit [Pseudomonadota bacterium]